MNRSSPPALACWLLQHFLPIPHRGPILGDLIEEYALRAESTSPFAASRWFWSQAFRSVPLMIASSRRAGGWLTSIVIALSVYIGMASFKLAIGVMVSKLVAPGQTGHIVLNAVEFLMATAVGGCIAARIRRGATIFLALLVMFTVAILIELKLCTIPVPWWYQFGFLSLGPLAVLIAPAIIERLTLRAEGRTS
jgi:hypothetical protein